MPYGVGFEAFGPPNGGHRYLTSKDTEKYSVSGSARYSSVTDGQHVTTRTYLAGGTIPDDGQPRISKSGETFSDWKSAHGTTLGAGESLQTETTVTTVDGPTMTATQLKTVTTRTTPWKVWKNGEVVRSGTEIIKTTNQTDLSDKVTYQNFWNDHVKSRPWEDGPPFLCGPLEWVDYNRGVSGDAKAVEYIRDKFTNHDFGITGTISNPGMAYPDYGADFRLKSFRWRWIKFNPQDPFSYVYAAPPADVRRTFHLLVSQYDFLTTRQWSGSGPLVNAITAKDIVTIECNANAGTSGWESVPLSTFDPYKLEDPAELPNLDFSRMGHSQVWFGNLPVELYSDLNNDGQLTSADSNLVGRPYASGASEAEKDKGSEFMFANDNLSNGAWDKEDTDPARPATEKDDDDAEEIVIKPGITEGEVWLEHPAIAGLSFYKTRECKADDKVNLSPTSKFTVSASNPFPAKLFMRADDTLAYPDANPQFEGDLVLKIKVDTAGQEIEAVKMKLTVVKDFGAKMYFQAANDYLLENNAELFVHEKSYGSVFFRLCLMREEGTDVLPLELYEPAKDNWIQAGSVGNFSAYTYREAAGISEVMINNPDMTVVINGNQCGFTSGLTSAEAAAMSALGDPQITDKCQGRLKELSASQSSVSNDHFDENTNIPGTQMKGSVLAGPDPLPGTTPPQAGGKYIAQYPDGKIVVGLNYAPDFSAPPNPSYMLTQMGGLSSSYSSSDRSNYNNSLVGTAPIGITSKKMVFVIMGKDGSVGKGKTVELYNSAVSSGVPQISGATTPSGSLPPITMVFLDSGVTSCALDYKKPSGTLDLLYKGSKHNGSPYYTNTFLQFKASKPRP
jgi:hypothetical protein